MKQVGLVPVKQVRSPDPHDSRRRKRNHGPAKHERGREADHKRDNN